MAEPPQQMDEILASIRRIITDEPARPGDGGSGQAVPDQHAEADEGGDDVLQLGAPPPAAAVPATAPPPPAPDLLSDASTLASRSALAALADLKVDPNAADNTLDGLVRAMLRPMLKEWLDRNLPELVERLVQREIARLGGR